MGRKSIFSKTTEKENKENKENVEAEEEKVVSSAPVGDDDFTNDLIKSINKEVGSNIAFNLSGNNAPIVVKRWISSGSYLLNSILSNKIDWGYPEGRIIEISGPTGIGKTHLAYEAAKSIQSMGGIVIYIDSENSSSVENLKKVGVNVAERFLFVQTSCIEEIFTVIEKTILRAREKKDNTPFLVIWDSIAASAPKAEIEGDYDQNTIGLAARVYGKGFRKITSVIAHEKVVLLLINQNRQKIGVVWGDSCVSPDTKLVVRKKIS